MGVEPLKRRHKPFLQLLPISTSIKDTNTQQQHEIVDVAYPPKPSLSVFI